MASIKGIESRVLDGSGLRIGIVHTKWNATIIDHLLEGCLVSLRSCGVREENIVIIRVPGSYELPFAAKCIIEKEKLSHGLDAVICLGCLIKGDTMHFEYIADSVTQGLMTVQLEQSTPIIFGVLMCLNENQARIRAGLDSGEGQASRNHGEEWGETAVEMALLRKNLS